MHIRTLSKHEPLPMKLLLQADPSESLIRAYCRVGKCVIGECAGELVGVYVLIALSETTVEIKNLAVSEKFQKQGFGRKLIEHALTTSAVNRFQFVEIGTGNSSISQLSLYQRCGFQIVAIDRDFFRRHYPEPIFENGIECRDLIRLRYAILQDEFT